MMLQKGQLLIIVFLIGWKKSLFCSPPSLRIHWPPEHHSILVICFMIADATEKLSASGRDRSISIPETPSPGETLELVISMSLVNPSKRVELTRKPSRLTLPTLACSTSVINCGNGLLSPRQTACANSKRILTWQWPVTTYR